MNFPLATSSWDDSETQAMQKVIESGMFTMGKHVAQFEEKFAQKFGSKYALMVNSGSSANLLAVAGLLYHPKGLLKPGDAVLVPAVSWSTTYAPIYQHGLELRFVDIDKNTLNIDLNKLEKALTPNTKAVFAVNLLGNPCDFVKLNAFCEKHDLILFEDNCESMGATLNGKQAGSFGICGTFSTFFSHHISTMEGGVVITDDEELYHTMLSIRSHGWVRGQPEHSHLTINEDPFVKQFRFVLPGYNLRPLELSGALGCEQLIKLPKIVQGRRQNAKLFVEMFGNNSHFDIQMETGESSWFGFSMVLKNNARGRRSEISQALMDNNIDCRPIVTGNFLNNPVIEYYNYSVGSEISIAEEVDVNGLFIGNHHFPLEKEFDHLLNVFDQVL